MVTFNSLDLVVFCKAPVSVHLESDMFWDRPLLKGPNKHVFRTSHEPFRRRRLPKPISNMGEVKIGHSEGGCRGMLVVVAQNWPVSHKYRCYWLAR